jgi:hypothetical protein
LKKRTKKLFLALRVLARAQAHESLFASFSTEKEGAWLPFPSPRRMR